MIELIPLAVALVGSAVAAFEDFRTGFISDELNYAMISVGVVSLFVLHPFSEALVFAGVAVAVFVAGTLFYLFGQLGGGDVKWFTALALLLPVAPEAGLFGGVAAPYPFVVSVFFVAAVLSLFFVSGAYALRLLRDRNEVSGFRGKLARATLYCAALVPLFYVWSLINVRVLVLSPPMLLGAFVLAFKEDILRNYVVGRKAVSALNDDDVLAVELWDEKTKRALGVSLRKTFLSVELNELKSRARKAGIKTVLVSEYLPVFGPFIFVSLVLNAVLGDAFLWLLFA
ncbi:MAG: prepilin peptidase [Candidatus Diapherotrites archaeon]|nr:prepilin peptidase [Candidatus Diapherotrites archaeon]